MTPTELLFLIALCAVEFLLIWFFYHWTSNPDTAAVVERDQRRNEKARRTA